MKLVRRIHLWLSIFFAPTIVFFAISGLVMLLEWHEAEGGAQPSSIALRLAQVHKSQSLDLPPARAPRPPATASDNLGVDRAAAARLPEPRRARPHRSAPAKAFFVIMVLALLATTTCGVLIALSFRKDRRLILGALAAGTLVPIVLLLL
ncbi:MAG: hypothetical protein IPL61_30585 [Myxococcales bacterium]|nr:hypothetical protein [Myxococcales bacterium]